MPVFFNNTAAKESELFEMPEIHWQAIFVDRVAGEAIEGRNLIAH